jgi:hypothetical protein
MELEAGLWHLLVIDNCEGGSEMVVESEEEGEVFLNCGSGKDVPWATEGEILGRDNARSCEDFDRENVDSVHGSSEEIENTVVDGIRSP